MDKAAHAYDVLIAPQSPQLGDTISVIVRANGGVSTVPTITANGKAYPSFPLSNNRFRTFIPASPLDPPGRMVIRVSGVEETRNLAVGLRDRSFRTQRITLRGSGSLGTDYEFDRVDAFKRLVSDQRHRSGVMLRPSQGRVSSESGQRVGAIGATGAATGPHLHWGLYVNQVAVDPVPWRYDGFE